MGNSNNESNFFLHTEIPGINGMERMIFTRKIGIGIVIFFE